VDDRRLITDELIEMRYRASLSPPPVRDFWQAMFPNHVSAGWTT
jgi:hypothetical protein